MYLPSREYLYNSFSFYCRPQKEFSNANSGAGMFAGAAPYTTILP